MDKPFTELPAPKRTHHLAVIAAWIPNRTHRSVHCESAACEWPDFAEEVSECPVCGRWMCDECFGNEGVMIPTMHITNGTAYSGSLCCADCSKLTNDERQTIMELRAKLGGAL